MRVTYRRELDVKNLLDQQGVSSFIPMHYVIRMAKKRKVRELVPVVHNLIFIHITQTDKQTEESGKKRYSLSSVYDWLA